MISDFTKLYFRQVGGGIARGVVVPDTRVESSSKVRKCHKFRNRSEGLLPAGVRPVVNARQATGPLGGAGGMRDADRGGPAGRQGRADGR